MLSLLLLAACFSTDDTAEPTVDSSILDADNDGSTPTDGDCDDADAAVFPGAEELCNDLDDNCDGAVDEDVAPIWFADADGDGFGDFKTWDYACEQPAGFVVNDLDCDDTSAARYPDSVEVPYDGIDQDCSGEDATCADMGETYTGNLSIGGDDDISGFCSDYANVSGNVQIIGRTTDDLTGLECLCSVDGGLGVWSSTLTSLHGLEGVYEVGRLELIGNANLASLDGLDNLRTVDELYVYDLPSLESVAGLGAVSGALTSVQLLELPTLLNLDGLEGVESAALVELDQLSSLVDVNGLSGFQSADVLTITSMPDLASLAGLAALSDCGSVELAGTGVDSLEGLGGLWSLDSLDVVDNDSLTTMAGMEGLTRLGEVSVQNNARLGDVAALAAVGEDADQVIVYNNASLADISALAATESVTYLYLSDNALTDLSALSTLTTVGTLALGEPGVTSLSGLASLKTIGAFELWDGGYPTLGGMSALTRISDLVLSDLVDLTTLEALAGVDLGDIEIYDAESLVDLRGLEGWTGGSSDDLVLDDNDSLTSLVGLEGVTTLKSLEITDNAVLPTADAEALCLVAKGDLADCTISGNQ